MQARESEFRTQLIGLMGAVVVFLLVGIVSVMLYVARHHLFEVGANEAVARAQAYALKAAFPILVGQEDTKEAAELLAKIVESPQTLAAELIEPNSRSISAIETEPGQLGTCRFADSGADGKVIYHRAKRVWCTSVPVHAAPEGEEGEIAGQVIGRLRIVSSQTSLVDVVNSLFLWGAAAGVCMMCLALLLVHRAARQVTKPLQRIVDVMRKAQQGEPTARIQQEGPQECITIAGVYNDLMDQLNRQATDLEARVEERTRQLHQATQAARAAEKSKSEWMRTAGHEMKTPLHVIDANVRKVASELVMLEGSSEARNAVEIVLRETEELSRRVSQILASARAEAGNYQPVRERFCLRSVAEDIREKAEPVAIKNENVLEVSVCDCDAYTDRDMLLQICSNLAINGCKFTTQGKVIVTLRSLGDALEIEVIDTGRGIPASQLPVVWEEFRQVDMGEGRRFGGFGLGLAIVKRFTEILGGTAELKSEQGRGTCVTVRLPGTILSEVSVPISSDAL